MRKAVIITILLLLCSSLAFSEPIVFPKQGQNKAQQIQDKGYCEIWAKDETGVDPSYIRGKLDMIDSRGNESSSSGRRGGGRILRGAALGAAMGGLDDAIDNQTGKRAAQGAVLAASRSRQARKQAYQNKQASSNAKTRQNLETSYDKYSRAYSACMDAKGYSVK